MPVIKRDYERLYIKPYAPRIKPSAIPEPGIFDDPVRCLKVNAVWASHVIGVLQALDQPDTWVGDDDQIFDARQQIRELIESFKSENCQQVCPDEPECPETALDRAYADGYSAGSGDCGDCGDCEGDNMGGCCIDKLAIRSDGLWYRKCGEWFKLDNSALFAGSFPLTDDPDDPDETIIEPTTPEEAADWLCAKASVISALIFDVLHVFVVNWTEGTKTLSKMIEDATGVDMPDFMLLGLQFFMLADEVLPVEIGTLDSAANELKFKCALQTRLDGSNNDLGPNQFEIVRSEFAGLVASILGREFCQEFINDIGLDDLRAATRSSIMTAYDCTDCLPAPVSLIPSDVSYEWAHFYDFTVDDYGWTPQGTGTVWTEGQGLVSHPASYGDRLAGCTKTVPTPAAAGFDFTFCWVKFTEWPAPADGAVTYWFKLGPDVIYSDPSLWGLPIVQTRTNKHVSQGQPIEISWPSTLGNPPSGHHILAELLIAGINDDPFPDDPDYIPE